MCSTHRFFSTVDHMIIMIDRYIINNNNAAILFDVFLGGRGVFEIFDNRYDYHI